jgi:hypothetical protein
VLQASLAATLAAIGVIVLGVFGLVDVDIKVFIVRVVVTEIVLVLEILIVLILVIVIERECFFVITEISIIPAVFEFHCLS